MHLDMVLQTALDGAFFGNGILGRYISKWKRSILRCLLQTGAASNRFLVCSISVACRVSSRSLAFDGRWPMRSLLTCHTWHGMSRVVVGL